MRRAALTIGILVSILEAFATLHSDNPNNTRIYPQTMAVVEINTIGKDNHEIVLETFSGYQYTLFTDDISDVFYGDLYSCTMSDNGTDTIEDDIILDNKYSGWVDSWGYGNNKHSFDEP